MKERNMRRVGEIDPDAHQRSCRTNHRCTRMNTETVEVIWVYLCSSVAYSWPATIGLRSVPSFSTLTSNTSPFLRNTGGLRNAPTPSGVPLAITSPGSSVIPCDRYETRYATLKIIFEVFDDCMTLPLSSP